MLGGVRAPQAGSNFGRERGIQFSVDAITTMEGGKGAESGGMAALGSERMTARTGWNADGQPVMERYMLVLWEGQCNIWGRLNGPRIPKC